MVINKLNCNVFFYIILFPSLFMLKITGLALDCRTGSMEFFNITTTIKVWK